MEQEALKKKLLYDTRQIKRLHKKFQELETDRSDRTFKSFLVELESMKYTLKKNGLYSSLSKTSIDFDEKQREIDQLQVELEQRLAYKQLELEYDVIAKSINRIHSREYTAKQMQEVGDEIVAIKAQISSTNEQILEVTQLYQKMNLNLLDIEKELNGLDKDAMEE